MTHRTAPIALLLFLPALAQAEPATPHTALARMPVKEVTVFKDGHAFVLHAGKMPTDPAGNVVIDALPQPVLGTFWPYSTDKAAKLTSVVASAKKVKLDRTALTTRELIEANVGAEAVITEAPIPGGAGKDPQPLVYTATIVAIPTQTGEELEATSPPNTGERLSVKGNVVLLKTAAGTKVVDFSRIVDVTFTKAPKPALEREEFRNLFTLKLDWPNNQPAKEAEVGMVYLQKGIRWIPNYKVVIDGKGDAVMHLQATLVNELTDLEDVTCHLVIGVPSFAFATLTDPVALQQTAAQLSVHFARNPVDSNYLGNQDTTFALSNGIMSQQAIMEQRVSPAQQSAPAGGGAGPINLGPDIGSSGKSEDLFLFSVNKVTLKKGQRMTLPVAQYKVKYKDVYALDIPVAPPPEVFRAFDENKKAELVRLFAAPKVMHKVRLFNNTAVPFTTAPAIIVQNDRLVAQGMTTYTAIGAACDLELTAAIDVSVKKSEAETSRTPKAARWNGDDYMRVDLSGKISLRSFARQPVEVEVTRSIMGNVDQADAAGKIEALNLLEESGYAGAARAASAYNLPNWHSWYSWPYWWSRFNGVGKVTWNLKLDPEKPQDLNYTWHYFWR